MNCEVFMAITGLAAIAIGAVLRYIGRTPSIIFCNPSEVPMGQCCHSDPATCQKMPCPYLATCSDRCRPLGMPAETTSTDRSVVEHGILIADPEDRLTDVSSDILRVEWS